MTRKIIQIATERVYVYALCDVYVYALCDDGTLWLFRDTKWVECIKVPQPDDLPSTRTPQEILKKDSCF